MSSVTATAPEPLNKAFAAFLTGAEGFCQKVLAKLAQTDSLLSTPFIS
jgi:hypothetical protein